MMPGLPMRSATIADSGVYVMRLWCQLLPLVDEPVNGSWCVERRNAGGTTMPAAGAGVRCSGRGQPVCRGASGTSLCIRRAEQNPAELAKPPKVLDRETQMLQPDQAAALLERIRLHGS